jgi:hypothetical protein
VLQAPQETMDSLKVVNDVVNISKGKKKSRKRKNISTKSEREG